MVRMQGGSGTPRTLTGFDDPSAGSGSGHVSQKLFVMSGKSLTYQAVWKLALDLFDKLRGHQ